MQSAAGWAVGPGVTSTTGARGRDVDRRGSPTRPRRRHEGQQADRGRRHRGCGRNRGSGGGHRGGRVGRRRDGGHRRGGRGGGRRHGHDLRARVPPVTQHHEHHDPRGEGDQRQHAGGDGQRHRPSGPPGRVQGRGRHLEPRRGAPLELRRGDDAALPSEGRRGHLAVARPRGMGHLSARGGWNPRRADGGVTLHGGHALAANGEALRRRLLDPPADLRAPDHGHGVLDRERHVARGLEPLGRVEVEPAKDDLLEGRRDVGGELARQLDATVEHLAHRLDLAVTLEEALRRRAPPENTTGRRVHASVVRSTTPRICSGAMYASLPLSCPSRVVCMRPTALAARRSRSRAGLRRRRRGCSAGSRRDGRYRAAPPCSSRASWAGVETVQQRAAITVATTEGGMRSPLRARQRDEAPERLAHHGYSTDEEELPVGRGGRRRASPRRSEDRRGCAASASRASSMNIDT